MNCCPFIQQMLLNICFALLLVTLSAQVVIVRSDVDAKLVTLDNTLQSAGALNVNQDNYIGNNVKWIWNTEGDLSPEGLSLTFETLFYMNCGADAILTLAADAFFTAYLDGVVVATGSYKNIQSYNISNGCGSHNLTIVATKGYDATSTGGLIFSITQNQDSCFNCGVNGFWNYQSCKCLCNSACGCTAPRVWSDWPSCSCKCPSNRLLAALPLLSANSFKSVKSSQLVDQISIINRFRYCPAGQYYSEATCSCQCVRKYCGYRQQFRSDPKYCGCYPIIY